MKLLFDIGATHLRVAYASEHGPEHILHTDTPADPHAGVSAFLHFAHELGSEYESATGGFAGVIKNGVIETSTNRPKWNTFALADTLAHELGCPVSLINDAEIAGLGEAQYGAGKGYGTVAYIGLGTGVGTALIRDGQVVPHTSGGNERCAVIMLADGRTLEEVASGHAVHQHYGAPAETLSPEVWSTLAPLLAEVVKNAITRWSPDVVVLAGSLMNPESGFDLEEVRALVSAAVPIEHSVLGDSCGLWGAYALVV